MSKALEQYLKIFKKLRIDRSHGVAPHKPVLLISVLQGVRSNVITNPRVYITPELVALFKANWSLLVTSKHDCRLSYPFYYMKSEGFWRLVPKAGFDNLDKLGSIVKSFSSLRAAVEYAVLEEELFLLMKDEKSNSLLVQLLLDEYFAKRKNNFNDTPSGQQNLFDDIEDKILHESPEEYRREIKQLLDEHNDEEIYIRGSLFKREIPKIYRHTCCVSGMKIDAIGNVSMIDACHIVPFSVSYDDTVRNGIALCPNLHRAFDRGLITIDNDYRVAVSDTFNEEKSSYSIRHFEGKEILLPSQKKYFPLKESLEWHRNNVFK